MYIIAVCLIAVFSALILFKKIKKHNKIIKTLVPILFFMLVLIIGAEGYVYFINNISPDNVQINTKRYDLLESEGELVKIHKGEITCFVDEERYVLCEDGILNVKCDDITMNITDNEVPELVLNETIYFYESWKRIFLKSKRVVEYKAHINLPRELE